MAKLWIDGEWEEYKEGATWKEVAAAHQERYSNDILLVKVNGKLEELYRRVPETGKVELITAEQDPGIQTYFRSSVFLLFKSFCDVAGEETASGIELEFSIGNGYFIKPKKGICLSPDLLKRVKERMEELVRQIPFLGFIK